MTPLNQSTVIVTGASGGIGMACVRAFLEAGARVVMTDIREEKKALTLMGDQARFVRADLRDEESVKSLVATAVREFGSLDVLVNNAAAIEPMLPAHETTTEQFGLLFDVNVRGPFFCCKHAYAHLKQSKGAIINVSSMAGVAGEKHHAVYAATKGAMNALTRSMAIDYGRDGVRVNAVCPSSVLTPNTDKVIAAAADPVAIVELRKNINLLGYTATPGEIAAVVVFLASPAASFITGAIIPASGGAECGYGIKY